jgi:hypothetical protein
MADGLATLGEKLEGQSPPAPPQSWARHILYAVLNALVWAAFIVLGFLWAFGQDGLPVGIAAIGLLVLWVVVAFWGNRNPRAGPSQQHFLLAGDRQQFMSGLRLDAKTCVFDGNNIYHFGLSQDAGADALRLIAAQLRTEGYRVVCFFDANIHYTLIAHGHLSPDQRHTIGAVMQVFGLAKDEIYIVPSGVQADRYILSTLKHLPVSFAVTNDQFRDYAKVYPSVMRGDQWRKGVTTTGAELRLHKFQFKEPVRMPAPRG